MLILDMELKEDQDMVVDILVRTNYRSTYRRGLNRRRDIFGRREFRRTCCAANFH
jgi:hypothetical protein